MLYSSNQFTTFKVSRRPYVSSMSHISSKPWDPSLQNELEKTTD